MKQIIAILLIALTALSCKKESPVGPSLLDLYGPFTIKDSLSINNINGVDFSKNETVKFKGSWTTITPWTITITGKSSGAVKIITGKSKTLDTLLSIWDGSSNCIYFKKEDCNVQLTFNEHPETMNCNVKINGTHDYSKDGILLQSFESPITLTGGGNTTISQRESTLAIPEGNYYYHIEGYDAGGAWWFGSIPVFTAKQLFNTTYFPFELADTSTTYINFFVYGYGYENTKIIFTTYEDDNGDGIYVKDNADVTKIEDSYGYEYLVKEPGWQKVSIPFSSFTHSTVWINGIGYHYGNLKKEINKTMNFEITFNTTGVKTDKVGCAVDFFIITKGKPL